jgi:NAD(P)-dependent dehydrogenase (short-subunit alcohol dehydrogenase family)
MLTIKAALAGTVACAFAATAALAEPKTNMLHQWSEGADAAAIAKLGDMFTAAGGKWEQTSIAGHTANTLAKLRADVVAGNAPPAVQLKGPEIAEWNATGMTANLDDLANKEGWDKAVAPELLPVMKPTGNWVAAPMNIHRINWIWASTKAMEKAGVKDLPKTWAEFNADCDKAVAAHLICIAHNSADWTDATTFEVIVYGQDIDLFRKAFVQGDTEAMRSDGMVKAFEQFRTMVSKYMDPAIAARDYQGSLDLITKNQAVFMIMGDWNMERLAELGADVAIHDISWTAPAKYGEAADLGAVAKAIARHGGKVMAVSGNIGDKAAVAKMKEEIEAKLGRVDILVNCAGGDIGASGGKPEPNDALGIPLEDIKTLTENNLYGTILVCQAFVPPMVKAGSGSVINIGSAAAQFGVTNGVIYAALKAAVIHYTRCLAKAVRTDGVRINAVSPGATKTARFEATRVVDPEMMDSSIKSLIRYGEPEEMADAVAFLARSKYISGQVLRVDGGETLFPG